LTSAMWRGTKGPWIGRHPARRLTAPLQRSAWLRYNRIGRVWRVIARWARPKLSQWHRLVVSRRA